MRDSVSDPEEKLTRPVVCPNVIDCVASLGCPHAIVHQYSVLVCGERLFGDCPECQPAHFVFVSKGEKELP